MRIDRLEKMERYIHEKRNASLKDLAGEFDVSVNTVRRDLEELAQHGSIKKVYGGVSSLYSDGIHIKGREAVHREAKRTIGKLTAELIQDHSTIFIDSGSTVVECIPHLAKKNDISITTANLKAMMLVTHYPKIILFGLGGLYSHAKANFIDSNVFDDIKEMNFDYILLATTGLSCENGLSVNSFFEVDLKKWLVDNYADRTILMVDSSKFDHDALYTFADFRDINTMVTDQKPSESYLTFMKENHIKCVFPNNK